MGIKRSISSGILNNSETVFEEEGFLNGAIFTGGSVDGKVTFYDSADSDIVDALEIGFVSQDVPFFNFAVHCTEGIYAQVENDADYMVLFSKSI